MSKNIVAFVIVSALILAGWTYLQSQLFPPAPAKKDEGKLAQKDPAQKVAPDKKAEEKKVDEKKLPEVKKVDEKKVEEKKPAVEVPAPTAAATYTLGDDKSFLKVVVTNRGGGVQRLTLNEFESADYLGRPTKDRARLDLVQDDPFLPSFRMYHFADVTAGAAPVLGLGEALWNVDGGVVGDKDKGWKLSLWTLVPDQPQLKIVKTYHLQANEYHVGLTLEMHNTGSEKTPFRYQLTGAHGLPIEGEWFTPAYSLRNAVIGVVDGRGSIDRKMEDSGRISHKMGGEKVPVGNGWMQYAGTMTQFFASALVVDPKQPWGDWKTQPSLLQWARPTHESAEVAATLRTITLHDAADDKHLEKDRVVFRETKGNVVRAKLTPRARQHLEHLGLKEDDPCVVSYYRIPDTDEAVITWFRRGQTPHGFFDDLTVRVNSEVVNLQKNDKVAHRFLLYHGPVKTRLLGHLTGDQKVAPELVNFYTNQLHLRTFTDYHSDTPFGWFFSKIGWTDLLIGVTILMHGLLFYLKALVFGNYGLSIILLTVVVRGAMFPISRRQALMSQKMQELGPELKKLNEKYKNDPQARVQATMELYRKHNVKPIAGCLPLFLQMPIFLGLYYALSESVEFRLADFLWIPNLAAPDMLFWWGESIPWISDPNSLGSMLYLGPFFNLLPILAVGFMVLQQKMLTPPAQNEEQEVQQRTMQIMMGVMGIFFYKVAAGLCIYFIASSAWGVAERKMLPKKNINLSDPGPVPSKLNTAIKDRRREREKIAPQPETALQRLKAWWIKILESAEKK